MEPIFISQVTDSLKTTLLMILFWALSMSKHKMYLVHDCQVCTGNNNNSSNSISINFIPHPYNSSPCSLQFAVWISNIIGRMLEVLKERQIQEKIMKGARLLIYIQNNNYSIMVFIILKNYVNLLDLWSEIGGNKKEY